MRYVSQTSNLGVRGSNPFRRAINFSKNSVRFGAAVRFGIGRKNTLATTWQPSDGFARL